MLFGFAGGFIGSAKPLKGLKNFLYNAGLSIGEIIKRFHYFFK